MSSPKRHRRPGWRLGPAPDAADASAARRRAKKADDHRRTTASSARRRRSSGQTRRRCWSGRCRSSRGVSKLPAERGPATASEGRGAPRVLRGFGWATGHVQKVTDERRDVFWVSERQRSRAPPPRRCRTAGARLGASTRSRRRTASSGAGGSELARRSSPRRAPHHSPSRFQVQCEG